MVDHKIPENLIIPLIKAPSQTKTEQVANMQNYIQELLGDTHYTFLQGSYKNDTAISDINDVDIVAVRIKTYSGQYSPHRFDNYIFWNQIFSEIEQKLRNQSKYIWTVERGDKCIKVRGAFNADIVPAVQVGEDYSIDPIVIYSFRSELEKLNYPRVHYENGVVKNKLTGGLYKPTVRMFKQWVKNHFGENKDIISSFKMEALVHAVDDKLFSSDHPTNFVLVANQIATKISQRSIMPILIPSVCGNEDISQNWDINNRKIFLNKIRESLNCALVARRTQMQYLAEDNWKKVFNI